MAKVKVSISVLVTKSVLVMLMLMFSARIALGRDPDLTTDFGINVTSAADLTFTGFVNLPDSPKGVFNITFGFVSQFPGVTGLGVSGALLKFGPNSLNSLHSHPRGSEFFYVIDGSVDLGLVDTKNNLYTTTLNVGEVFVFPQGLLHFQINRSKTKPATVLAAFGSDNAGRVSFPPAIFNSVPRIDVDVLQRAFDLDAETVERLLRHDFPVNSACTEPLISSI